MTAYSETETGVIELSPFPGWESSLGVSDNAEEALEVLLNVLGTAPAEVRRGAFSPENFYGMIMVTETWSVRSLTPEAHAEVLRLKGHLDIHPDRVESRLIYCVSTHDRVLTLDHEREGNAQI